MRQLCRDVRNDNFCEFSSVETYELIRRLVIMLDLVRLDMVRPSALGSASILHRNYMDAWWHCVDRGYVAELYEEYKDASDVESADEDDDQHKDEDSIEESSTDDSSDDDASDDTSSESLAESLDAEAIGRIIVQVTNE